MNLSQNTNKEEIWYLFCKSKFDSLPNTYILYDAYKGEEFLNLLNSTEINTIVERVPDNSSLNLKTIHELNPGLFVSFLSIGVGTTNNMIVDVTFYYKNSSNLEQIEKLILDLDKIKNENQEGDELELSNINIVRISGEKVLIEPLDLDIESDFSLEELYNEKFLKQLKKVKKKIKKSEKGLTIFLGERGLGKTELVKSLISDLEKTSIFIPLNLIELTINNPHFIDSLEQFDNPLLILDDFETFYNPQFSKSNFITSNILQLVDGFMSDQLNLNFLVILNESDIENIDNDLLDSNNLLEVLEFEKLEKELSTNLSKKLGFNKKFDSPQKISDIFNKRKLTKENKLGL
jgi:energy-coupling factor transporter ATP-binding protein EcfA2